jgi:hypothetical protein
MTFVRPIVAVLTPRASTTATVATTPLPIAVPFTPVRMHVTVPDPGVHVKLLPAAIALTPAATEIEPTLVGE